MGEQLAISIPEVEEKLMTRDRAVHINDSLFSAAMALEGIISNEAPLAESTIARLDDARIAIEEVMQTVYEGSELATNEFEEAT